MTYFNNINTLEELRKQYKILLKKYHPDNPGGNTKATQDINAEYEKLFKILKDKHESSKENVSSDNIKFDFSEDQTLREVLQQIINFSGINIEIIGSWIWVDGNTYQYKNSLKSLGFKWAGQKKKWYFHTEAFIKKSRKKLSMDDIRSYYGSVEIQTKQTFRLQQA